VKHAQQALKDKGYYNGHVNGVMDTNTRNALRRYQQDQGLSAGGRLTTETAEHLGIVAHGDHTDGSAVEQFEAAGSAIKTHYGTAGKEMGRGAKHMGSDVKKGHVVEGGKQLGKGAGRFGKHVGKGTAKAAKHTGKGVKKAVTPDHDKQ
jgi:peptidoglycan hydrolase-like protein with peptidoglycan-binding domain